MLKLNPRKGALVFSIYCAATYVGSVSALQNLDDEAMSSVSAQDGVRLISEFDMTIQQVSIRDGDDKGRISISDVKYRTAANRQQDIDFRVGSAQDAYRDIYGAAANCGSCVNQLGLIFYNRDLPYELSIGQIKINDKSVGKLSVYDYNINAFANLQQGTLTNTQFRNMTSFSVAAYAGGNSGEGLTFDMRVPITAQYSTEYEEDGIKFKSTIRHVDIDQIEGGTDTNWTLQELASQAEKGQRTGYDVDELNFGLSLKGLTIDGDPEGLRIGLPTITDGLIAFTDYQIGNDEIGYDQINDVILKDINILAGSYALLKPGLTASEDEIGLDLGIAKDSELTYIYRDDDDQVNARIVLEGNSATGAFGLMTTGAAINNGDGTVTRPDGTVIDGMRIGLGNLQGRIKIDELRLSPNTAENTSGQQVYIPDADRAKIPPLGELTINLNLANTSYIEIRGN